MEQVTWKGGTLAYIIRGTRTHQKTVFPTPPDLELQVGFVVYPSGGLITPHRHMPITRNIKRTCEVIVVKKGRCDVDLYDDECKLVATRELQVDDVLVVVSGGHGFRMHEDTILLEVKQGPYFGENEKEPLK